MSGTEALALTVCVLMTIGVFVLAIVCVDRDWT